MLSIVIVNHKNAPLLRLCLKSLANVLPKSFKHEIIVVDVEAGIETGHVVREEFPEVRYLPFKDNIGYTRGVNEALRVAKGNHIFNMNSDIIPLPGSLEGMRQYMAEHPDIGMLGPQLLNFDGSRQQSCFRFYTPLTIACRRTFLGRLPFGKKILNQFLMKDKDLSRPTPVDWLMGSAMMISRAAIDKTGLMDENLFLYMSDVDWPRRFWENGYRVVFYPEARMYHYHSRVSRGDVLQILTNRFTRLHIADGIRYFRKYGLKRLTYS